MLLTTALMVLLQLDLGFTRKPINIYWNSTNTLFSSSQEPSIDVNSDQSASAARQFDQINLICPSGRRNREMHIIYSVTRGYRNKDGNIFKYEEIIEDYEFESCEVKSEAPTIVAICDQPTNFLYFTITFRYFTPSPRQLEFKPGETYYFISTSSAGDLNSRRGGYCQHNNMRMQFRIGDALEEKTIPKEYLAFPPAFWSRYWRTRVPDARDEYTNSVEKARDYRDLAFASSSEQLPYTSGSTPPPHLITKINLFMALQMALLLLLLLR